MSEHKEQTSSSTISADVLSEIIQRHIKNKGTTAAAHLAIMQELRAMKVGNA